MSSKIDKDDLKGPDAFQSYSDKIFNYIERHGKTFAAAAVLIVVFAAGYVGYGYVRQAEEAKAANEIYKAEALLKKAQSDVREERAKKVGDLGAKKTADPGLVRPADFKKDYASLVEGVKAQIEKYSGSKSALVSALNLAYFFNEEKQFALAESVLNTAKYKPASGDILNGFLLMHHGLAELEGGQLDQALKSYQEIINTKGLKDFHPQALLKIGVLYQIKGDLTKAREQFEKVTHDFPETEASNTAQNYMRLLSLKAKQG